ncbi:MAG: peptide deformylase [Parvibaculales bacterium]
MTIQTIIAVPDARLKTISEPVAQMGDATRALMDDMLETMYAAHGIGLAAIQIGVPQRVIVMDLSPSTSRAPEINPEISEAETPETSEDRYDLSLYENEKPRFFVNPEIIWTSEETRNYQEGCLSVPNFYDDVARAAQCRVRFLDYAGDRQEIDCEDLLATCIQHEIDHLNGIVFLDHLSRVKREMYLKKLRKAQREKSTLAG